MCISYDLEGNRCIIAMEKQYKPTIGFGKKCMYSTAGKERVCIHGYPQGVEGYRLDSLTFGKD